MKTSIVFEGQKELISAIKRAPNEVMKEIRVAGKIGARDIQNEARANHRFTTRSGNLESAIETEYNDSKLLWKIGVDLVKAVYGRLIHDGAKALKSKNKKKARILQGRKPDRFITEAGQAKTSHVNDLFHQAIARAYKKVFK